MRPVSTLRDGAADAPGSGGELLAALQQALDGADRETDPCRTLSTLVEAGLDRLPRPGHGRTLDRWRALSLVGRHDLSLAKLYEGHTDALAIMAELGSPGGGEPGRTWGTWASESPGGRVLIEQGATGAPRLRGTKAWCSGAGQVSHGLLTAWFGDGRGPQLVAVDMAAPQVEVRLQSWKAVGMAASASADVVFDGAAAHLVGGVGDYLSRPGFWQGGAGVAACWFGGAMALADALHASLAGLGAKAPPLFKLAALGRVDVCMAGAASLLRASAAWIDEHPAADAAEAALRVRLAIEAVCTRVQDEVGRALGAGPFCRDAAFARMAADLPVFIRQSHGDHDFAALAERVSGRVEPPWRL